MANRRTPQVSHRARSSVGSTASHHSRLRRRARTWAEESDQISPRAVLTERARAELARRVSPDEHSVAQAARVFGVSWHAAMAAVGEHGRLRVDHLACLGAPSAIGLDETSFLAATGHHPTRLVTGIIDLDAGRLVDVLPARSAHAVTEWLAAKPAPWLAGIRHVVIDPYQPYATAVAKGLPAARVVVDHVHVIRLANAALDEVRRRVARHLEPTRQASGDTGHELCGGFKSPLQLACRVGEGRWRGVGGLHDLVADAPEQRGSTR
jgi:transposase